MASDEAKPRRTTCDESAQAPTCRPVIFLRIARCLSCFRPSESTSMSSGWKSRNLRPACEAWPLQRIRAFPRPKWPNFKRRRCLSLRSALAARSHARRHAPVVERRLLPRTGAVRLNVGGDTGFELFSALACPRTGASSSELCLSSYFTVDVAVTPSQGEQFDCFPKSLLHSIVTGRWGGYTSLEARLHRLVSCLGTAFLTSDLASVQGQFN